MMKQDRIGDALLAPSAAPGTRIGHALLWQPSFVRDEKILWHVPFLFWLLESVRPRRYLEVGVGEGVAYMAVCQALHRMRAHSQCYAVGTWEQSNEGDGVPERLAARNADLYEDFSQILSDGPEKAAEAIEDESIDLMLIDLGEAPEAASTLRERWLPKLSKSGILLLNGIDRGDSATTVLVGSLSEQSPTVRMPGGDGLLVVLPSRDPDEDAANIAALSPDDPAHKLIIQMFTRLGAGTYYETHARDDEQRASELDERIRAILEERDSLAAQLSELQGQYDARHRKVATLQSQTFDMQLAIAAAQSESERLKAQLGAAQAERDEAQELLEQERSARAEADERLSAMTAEQAELKDRVAELTTLHAQEARNHQHAIEELAARRKKQEEAALSLRAEQTARADAEKARDEAELSRKRELEARDEAEQLRERELEALDETRTALNAAETERASAVAEADALRHRVAELTLQSKREYAVMKSLIETAEQNENLITALGEELRTLRQQVDAHAAAAQQAEADRANAPADWLRRLSRRNA